MTQHAMADRRMWLGAGAISGCTLLANCYSGVDSADDPEFRAGSVSCIESVVADDDDGNVPANVLDGDLATRWSSHGIGSWVQADLAHQVRLCGAEIAWYQGDARKNQFALSTSLDGQTWTDVFQGESSGSTLSPESYEFAGEHAKHLRLTVNGNTVNDWASVTELQLVPCEEIGIASVTADDQHETNVAANVLDGDLATRWSSPGQGSWIDAELTAGADVCGAAIAWYRGNERKSNFELLTSNDGVSWTTVYEGTSSGNTKLPEEYGFDWTATKHLRLVVNGNTVNDWASVTELRALPCGAVGIAALIADDDDGNVPGNVADSQLSTRWSSPGKGSWIRAELTEPIEIDKVGIAWYKGDVRQSNFTVETSLDGVSWQTVHQGSSSGKTLDMETRWVAPSLAKFVRVTVDGNTMNDWASITELRVGATPRGCDLPSPSGGNGGGASGAADAFGVAKIYADLDAVCSEPACVRYAGLDGRDMHDDVENLPSYDGDGENPLEDLGDDVWGVGLDWSGNGDMWARLALWSEDNHPWLTMEVTAFVKVVDNQGDAAIQPYLYGGRHSSISKSVRCYGGAYKPKFRFNGKATIQKELCHSEYTSQKAVVNDAWDFEEGRWYGLKSVAYPTGGTVKIEMYLLENNLGTGKTPNLPSLDNQDWVLLTEASDTGWKIGSDYCEDACGTKDGTIFIDGNPVDEQKSQSGKTHKNANVGALRLDHVKAHVWGFSVRRVDPAQPLAKP